MRTAGLADLLVVRSPAEARHDARDAERPVEQVGELEQVAEAFGAAGASSGAHDDPRAGQRAGVAFLLDLGAHDPGQQVGIGQHGTVRTQHRARRRCSRQGVDGVARDAERGDLAVEAHLLEDAAAHDLAGHDQRIGAVDADDVGGHQASSRVATWARTSLPRGVPDGNDEPGRRRTRPRRRRMPPRRRRRTTSAARRRRGARRRRPARRGGPARAGCCGPRAVRRRPPQGVVGEALAERRGRS